MARVLVVDDSSSIRQMVRQVLGEAGHDVEQAADGREGLRLFLRAPHDLVVTDIVMPEMDGLELVGEVRRISSGTRVLVISSGGEREARELFLRNAILLGAHLTLAKPLCPNRVVEAVTTLLERQNPAERRSNRGGSWGAHDSR